jgi:hypothetical protein
MFLPILSDPWENVSMDFMMNEMDTILVVVNQFSKSVKIIITKMVVTTFDSTKLFFNMWVRHHMMLQFIVIDRDANGEGKILCFQIIQSKTISIVLFFNL